MSTMLRIIMAAVITAVFSLAASGADLTETYWRVSLDSGALGPVETLLTFREQGGGLIASSVSGPLQRLRQSERAAAEQSNFDRALFAIELQATEGGYTGRVLAPWPDGEVSLQLDGDGISGRIDGGFMAGQFSGQTVSEMTPLRDYPALLEKFDRVIADKLFAPADLASADYLHFREELEAIAALAVDDLDLLLGFRFAWNDKPFSHLQLRRFGVPLTAVIASFDQMRVGYEAARLLIDADIAVLTVDTMMGNDTIEQIDAAYQELAESDARALVIDLRGNGGGAFAVRPLLGHVIDQPVEAGYFISQQWNAHQHGLPDTRELQALAPYEGRSLSEFWHSVQAEPILRMRFEPIAPHFGGPVFVVVDGGSASATEMAAAAFLSSGRATLVGERTRGQMLSQSFFEVADGFVVSLPVADYISSTLGRIEGRGVGVDHEAPSAQALDVALEMAREALAR